MAEIKAKVTETVAGLADLKTQVSAWLKDKASATESAISAYQNKLTQLETGAVAQITSLSAELEARNKSLETVSTEKTAIITALDAACAAVKIEGGDTAKISAMAPAAKITALQTATSDAMAKMHVDPSKIPNSGTVNQGATMARVEFEKLAPKAQTAFFANGGKLQ